LLNFCITIFGNLMRRNHLWASLFRRIWFIVLWMVTNYLCCLLYVGVYCKIVFILYDYYGQLIYILASIFLWDVFFHYVGLWTWIKYKFRLFSLFYSWYVFIYVFLKQLSNVGILAIIYVFYRPQVKFKLLAWIDIWFLHSTFRIEIILAYCILILKESRN